jgi:PAS domain S-box-containing protein
MAKHTNTRLLSISIFLIGILTFSFIGVLLYTGNTSQTLANEQSPQIRAIKQIKIEIITAHLWLEEILSGDGSENIKSVYSNFEKADYHLNLLLNGGELESNLFFAIDNIDVQHKIREVLLVKDSLLNLTILRFAQLEKAQAGTSVDQFYDAVFERFIQKLNTAEKALLALQQNNIEKYNATQKGLFTGVIALGFFILLIFVWLERFKNRKQKQLLVALDKLKESESQFRSLIEQSGDSMYLSDFDGNIVNVNKKACETLGYKRDELLKINVSDIDVNYPLNDDQKKLWNSIIPGRSQMIETQHKCKNGTLIPVELTFGFYEFSNKKLILGFARDISERKKAEELIRKSELELKEAQRIGQFGSWYLNLATNDVVWTDELYKMYHFDPNFPPPPLTEHQKLFTPENWERLNNAIIKTSTTGISYELELETIRKDGSNGWLLASGEPVRDANDIIIGLRGTAQDITERKQNTQKLIDSEKLLNDTQQLTKGGGWKWNVKNQSMFWTKETYRIHEIDPTDIKAMSQEHIQIGLRCYDEKDRETIIEAFNNCVNNGIPYNLEVPFTTANGNKIWVRTTARAEKENGTIVDVIGNIMDITKQKQAQDKIRRLNEDLEHKVTARTVELDKKSKDLIDSQNALLNIVEDLNEQSFLLQESTKNLQNTNKELEAFSYSVSHDLRAPLRGIDGFSQALLEDYSDILDEQGKSYLNRVRLGSQKMALLIDEMLNLSRLGRIALKPTTVNLSDIAQSISNDLRESDPERTVEFIIAKDLICLADPTLIRAVLQNLLENAWKFTSKIAKPKIEFGEIEIGKEISYFVKDNGAGFNMKYENKLFTPFQRLHQEREFPGTGIGLTTVQRIIHRHNGTVWAESKVDLGSTFYFTLNS